MERKDADKEASAITRQLLKFRSPDPEDNWVNKNLKFVRMLMPAVSW